jgi:hypothetical protein
MQEEPECLESIRHVAAHDEGEDKEGNQDNQDNQGNQDECRHTRPQDHKTTRPQDQNRSKN